ncbi:MAG: D-alanyl-D-alanine carboxypeptidase [Clostridia bacterium]|nr:D-alanyl-D-alanine carboxypeptidase [Clostridia bacterium]
MSLEVPKSLSEVVSTAAGTALEVGGKSAVLMELSSGQVLFEKNTHEKLPIASVTKIMTLLLVMEALDKGMIDLQDPVTCSAEAASMGGSQIWLEPGEIMTVHELIKAAAVVSANDACAALAEHVAGSIEEFVQRMNTRAAELGMQDTLFKDCSGLDDTAYSCAYDVALMSRELMMHPLIKNYTTIWMDTLRNGESQLVNTNKLIRFYQGATGLKTGTTSTAGHNLSATAERNGLGFVAVILGCSTTDERFGGARKLLDHGFANYALYTPQIDPDTLIPIPVLRGTAESVTVESGDLSPILVKKGEEKELSCTVTLSEDLEAPVTKGQIVGAVTVSREEKTIAEYAVRAAEEVPRLSFGVCLLRLFTALSA